MPEEVVLLVEKEFAVLIDDPPAHHSPSTKELESWDTERKESIAQQLVRLEREAGSKEDRTMSEEAVRKRKDREEHRRKAEELALRAAEAGKEGGVGSLLVSLSEPSKSHPSSIPASIPPYTVAIPTTSNDFDWYTATGHTHATLASARDAGVWNYPSTEDERAKCAVFRDLWEKGYYMGGGSKFGGDWLVYPGDPLRYHSHFAATVQVSPSAPLRPMEIVAHGRLGTATKKAHLLCGWDPASGEVTYLSIEWAGFG